ncbi:28S ribosomal protein S29, mitochondrial [Nilaparvata lugens]|uniref:28S ribosomal protein S29, mitochondrial n=1 Tax=Nilaparvata lugens TaxID=108931 RepID=UPI00193CEC7A|nr:28S ribosomal protein S29, mitochondrial [Nilaparvata lugens]
MPTLISRQFKKIWAFQPLLRHFSSEATVAATTNVNRKRPVALRTPADPLTHSEKDIGHSYIIPQHVLSSFFALGGIPKTFASNIQTFNEAAIMIRPHTIELLNYLRNANYSHPPIRYVLYGKPGCGKTMTCTHILHYAHLSGFIVAHIPWVWNWYRRSRNEAVSSETKPGLVNMPIEGMNWLKYFLSQNEEKILKANLRTSKEYVWSSRETTPADTSLLDLIQHGIGRIKYSCDVVDVLIDELKLNSTNNKCKMMIVVDGFNAFFLPFSNLKKEDRTRVLPDQVTLAQTFFKAVQPDWCNGAVVLTVDQFNTREEHPLETPLYLLKKRGLEVIDPFIPIEVPNLSKLEFNNLLDYYEDRLWIQRPGARDELEFLSVRNPYQLFQLCAPL